MRPWPEVADDDRWLITLMEDLLDESEQSPEQLKSRAQELRDEADQTDVDGYRTAALALAERYEQAAAAPVSARFTGKTPMGGTGLEPVTSCL